MEKDELFNKHLVKESSSPKNEYLMLCKKISHLIMSSNDLAEVSYLSGLLSMCVSGGIDSRGKKKLGIIKSLISRRKWELFFLVGLDL